MADEASAMIDKMSGMFLTALSGLPAANCWPGPLNRRKIETPIFAMRKELSEAATKLANERGEPPLSEQQPGAHPA